MIEVNKRETLTGQATTAIRRLIRQNDLLLPVKTHLNVMGIDDRNRQYFFL
jgi:hypothetical protein